MELDMADAPRLLPSGALENSGYLTDANPPSISEADPPVHVLASRLFAGRESGLAAGGFTKRLEGVHPPWVHVLLHTAAGADPRDGRGDGPGPVPKSRA